MAISGSGLYGLTLEKLLIGALAESFEAEDNKVLMVTDTYTPAYDTHDFHADVTNEVSGTGYTAGGQALTATEITLAAGILTFDAADLSWTSSTITDAMAAVHYFNVGTSGTDALGFLSDFVTAASTVNGTFAIQWSGSGIFTVDYVP